MNATEATIRVLVVDDDEEFADTVGTILEREDGRFDVRTATAADEGAEAIETGLVDCVVSDYGMPGTNGVEFLETVRAEHGEVPFVLLTGEGDEAVASDAISAGVTDYFRKGPGTDQFSLLASRLADAVEKRRARASLRRRKQELESLNDRFQSFVRHSPDVVTVLDDDGTIRYNSPAIERVLGYDQDEPVGDAAAEYIHPEDRDHTAAEFRAYLESEDGSRRSFEYRALKPDGESVWVGSIVSKRPEGSGGGFLVNTRDISDRKGRERELEAKTERLEEFASIVSHDLQTPITVADARLELAMEECDSEHLPSIEDALDRMDEIIDATLTLAREGQVVDETEPVELTSAVGRWSDTIESERLTIEIEADKLRIEADPGACGTSSRTCWRTSSTTPARTRPSSSANSTRRGFISPTTAPGSPRTSARRSSSPASRPPRTARASGSRSSGISSTPTAGTSRRKKARSAGRASRSPASSSPDRVRFGGGAHHTLGQTSLAIAHRTNNFSE